MKKTLLAIALGLAGMVTTAAQAAPTYLPVGAQSNVALATITGGGWTQCYSGTFDLSIGSNAENVLTPCQGDYLMMAGRETGSSTFLSLAAAPRADTIFETGDTSTTHVANGANWWFSDDWSWGFTQAGDSVDNGQCDTSDSPVSMCLHTIAGVGGYRINNITSLNGSTAYEKVFFVASAAASPNNVPEPGSLALASLALLGAGIARRRRAGR